MNTKHFVASYLGSISGAQPSRTLRFQPWHRAEQKAMVILYIGRSRFLMLTRL